MQKSLEKIWWSQKKVVTLQHKIKNNPKKNKDMAATRTTWNFVGNHGIKHISETLVWTVYEMPSFNFERSFCSLSRAKTYCKNN